MSTYRGDDPSTPDVNEAWEGGEPPAQANGLRKRLICSRNRAHPRQPSVGGVFNTTSGKLMKTYSSAFLSQHGQSWRQGSDRKVRVNPRNALKVLQGVDPEECGFVFHAESLGERSAWSPLLARSLAP